MAGAGYALVFRGKIVDGFDRPQVMRQFGDAFGLSIEDVAKVFGRPKVVLKRDLSREAATALRNRLWGIGMAVSLDDTLTQPPPAAPAPGVAPATAPGSAEAASAVARPAQAMPPIQRAAAPQADDEVRVVPFEFSGQGSEFFRIWIVNILLSIVTLGVYSAWAKVRTQRYFYGNTRLDGASFDYLANPVSILKGRLIGFTLLAVYMFADGVAPLLSVALMLAFLAGLPWIVVRGITFRNHNSAWRGVRFGFDGRLAEAYRAFLMWPLLGGLTLGLLFPYALWRQQAFVIGNSRYGVTHFEFHAQAGSVYRVFLYLVGVFVAGIIATVLVSFVLPMMGPLVTVVTYLAAFALFTVLITNLKFNHTTLGLHALEADYEIKSYAALMATNTIATALTLGLFYPWAKVRNARYAAEHVRVVADEDLDGFAAAQRQEVSAVGGEIGDLFDVDLGF